MEQSKKYVQPKHFVIVLILSLIFLVLCVVASLAFGARSLSMQEVIDGLLRQSSDHYSESIVQKRMVRTLFGLCCGAALGVAGVLMQAVTRNPIADPSILGVNMGAALFVVSGMAFFQIQTAAEYISFALLGALITSLIVFGIGSMGRGGTSPLKLVLAGAATSVALSSLVTAVMIPRSYVMNQFRYWQVGSIGAGTWDSLFLLLPFCVVGIVTAMFCASALNALALGDEAAQGLGVRTNVVRLFAAMIGVVLCGATTAVAGPIGFIGLLAAHVVRLLLGPDLRYVIPMSAISGAVILVLSDVIGRFVGRPGELEVGVITAFVGAPLLILLAMRMKVRSL